MTSLKLISSALMLTLVFDYSCSSKGDKSKSVDAVKSTNIVQMDTSLNGLYVGLEEMCYTDSTGEKRCYSDPGNPKWKWYHLTYLKIKSDSVFLDQNPITIYKKDTSYSASDGAFYYYSGTLQRNDTTILINLKQLFCDYCGVPVKIKPDGTQEVIEETKQLKGRLTDEGFIIDGYLYRRTIQTGSLISEHPGPFLTSP